MRLHLPLAILATLATSSAPARADAVADFYKGKTMRVVIGTGIGGTYGTYGQLVARHFGRHIPGSPTVVMQSMQGAGGFTALNWLGTQAPRDGTVVTIGHINIVHEGLFNPAAKFDPRGFQWVGRFTSFASDRHGQQGVRHPVARRRRSARGRGRRAWRAVGAGAGADHPQQDRRHEIQGRRRLSLDRRELPGARTRRGGGGSDLDGRAALALLGEDPERRADPDLCAGTRRLKEFPDAPTLLEFGNNDVEKAFLGVFSVTAEVGRSIATPPGVPADRLAALRAAYQSMVADPAFLADIKKLGIELDLLPGAELQEVIGASMKMSEETRAKARQFYEDLFGAH